MFSSLTSWVGQFFSMEGEPYKIQNDHHQKAAEYLRQALECDEQSSRKISSFAKRIQAI